MKTLKNVITGIAMIAVAGLIGCGSSSNNGNPVTPGAGSTAARVAIGTMAKGSVIVNGVRFEDNAATISADDTPKTAAFLADGMTVKVKGTVNDDGITGVAEKVESVNEVRGAIAAKGADTITVNGQVVLIDGGTVFANTTGFATLAVSDNVEVHGSRDAAGIIHATRVEELGVGAVENEVRGVVSGKTATTFTIGGLLITYNANVVVPAGTTFANGDVVEVHLDGSTASKIVVEHLEHPEFEHVEGQEFSFEGILSGFSETGTFSVGSQQVKLAASNVRIEGGVLADLLDGMKIEAEGHTMTGGVLIADKIKIKDSIRIEANADSSGLANVLGKAVKTTTLTRLSSNLTSVATITAGDGLRIRGFMNRDGSSITALRVEKQSSPVDSNKIIIQGPVTNINATARTFTIIGITVSAGSSIARPNDDHGTDTLTMTADAFFASLTEGRSIVKAKGTISGTTLAASEIELE